MFTDIMGERRYKIALHIHTTLSDGLKTPDEVAKEYKDDGFDAMAITDHWKYHASGELSGLHIIAGAEYNIGDAETIEGVMHIVGLGMGCEPPLIKGETSRQQAVDGINEAGGVAVLAHPAWSLNAPEDGIELKGIELTEIYNTVSEVQESDRPYSGYFADLCANRGKLFGLLATDDAHYYDGRDNRKAWISLKADGLTDEDIVRALKVGDYYATQGPEVHLRREGDKLIIDCTPCDKIVTFSNISWTKSRALRGVGLTHFEYEIKDEDKWVRVEVTDAEGKKAWSNFIQIK